MTSEVGTDPRHHPDIEPFLISGVEITDKVIGHGAYGRVMEIKVDGAICAAKEIHQVLSQGGKSKYTEDFLRECKIMSALRHPNITQFLGFCFLDKKAPYPALVMERLATNLHDTLKNEDGPTIYIPLWLKFSILCDVACGLAYLHRRSIIHRDLTATNVLLTSGMKAKIADLGMSREVKLNMTKCPGNVVYMPPEAMEGSTSYTSAIDIFSWGVLAMFTMTQQFPKPRPATFLSGSRTMGRSELERRKEYMEKIILLYNSQGHPARPVISLIKVCLQNDPLKRPKVEKVLEEATKLRENNAKEDMALTKLQFIQRVTELKATINSRENELTRVKEEKEEEIRRFKEEKEKEIGSTLKQMNESLERKKRQLFPITGQGVQRSQSYRETGTRPPIPTHLKLESASDRHRITTPGVIRRTPTTREATQKISHCKMPLQLKWRRGRDALFGTVNAQVVIVQQNLYIGGGHTKTKEEEKIVQVYDPVGDVWNRLPECPTRLFSLCSDGENVFISCGIKNDLIFSMSKNGIWQHRTLLPTPKERTLSTCLYHHNYIIIACGIGEENKAMKSVQICDTTTSTWHSAQPLPVAGHSMCSVMCGDTWYLSGVWEDMRPHIYKVHITSLIGSATKGEINAKSLWKEVPSPPSDRFNLLKFHNALTAVGGKNYSQDIYQCDTDTSAWFKVGTLPVGLDTHITIELPNSGELFVACGSTKEKPYSEQVWIGEVRE